MTRVRRVLAVTLALTVLRLPVAVLMQALLPDISVAPVANYVALLMQSVFMFGLPGVLLMGREKPAAPAKAWLGWGAVCIAGALLARAVATPLNGWWSTLLGAKPTAIPAAGDAAVLVLQVLALAVIPAVAEELFFRGALLTALEECCPRWQATAVTTLVFALMHGSLAGLPGHLLISLLLTLLMQHTGRVIIPVAAHLLFNLSALCWPELPAAAPFVCGLALCALMGWLVARSPRGTEERLLAGEMLLCSAILLLQTVQYLLQM